MKSLVTSSLVTASWNRFALLESFRSYDGISETRVESFVTCPSEPFTNESPEPILGFNPAKDYLSAQLANERTGKEAFGLFPFSIILKI